MLIIVPSSETKRPPEPFGDPVILENLSFPELLPTRRRIANALVETSGDLDAFERLGVGPSIAPEVARNTHLYALPATPVLGVYTGPFHAGLNAAGLSAEGVRRAETSVVVNSALWGALRPSDRIPPYRLHVCAHLVGMPDLEPVWRTVLPDVLAKAAGNEGAIVDLRSPVYQATGMPKGMANRTVTLRIDPGHAGQRIGDVIAKRVRGEAAHHLLESGADPADPPALLDVLADRWPARLEASDRRGGQWRLTLSID